MSAGVAREIIYPGPDGKPMAENTKQHSVDAKRAEDEDGNCGEPSGSAESPPALAVRVSWCAY